MENFLLFYRAREYPTRQNKRTVSERTPLNTFVFFLQNSFVFNGTHRKGLPSSTQEHFDKKVLENHLSLKRRLVCKTCRPGDGRQSAVQIFPCKECKQTLPRSDFKAKDLNNYQQKKKKTLTCKTCLGVWISQGKTHSDMMETTSTKALCTSGKRQSELRVARPE